MASTSNPAQEQLPDINAPMYPFADVLQQLDESIVALIYSTPVGSHPGSSDTSEIILDQKLNRLTVTTKPDLDSVNEVGEALGEQRQKLVFISHDTKAIPHSNSNRVPFDPSASQRFALEEGIIRFGSGKNYLRAYGSGTTYPEQLNQGSTVQIGATLTIVEAGGQFSGLAGTLTLCGTLSATHGFEGAILLRLFGSLESQSGIITETPKTLPPGQSGITPNGTFLVLRGQKPGADSKTNYSFDEQQQLTGLLVHQDLRMVNIDFTIDANDRISTTFIPGEKIGSMDAQVLFNILNPGAPGTNSSPIPFHSINHFQFEAGGLTELKVEGGDEGRTFTMILEKFPGQSALRFGITGPAKDGTGIFAEKNVFLMDNSAVSVAPHAVSTLYLLQIHPSGASPVPTPIKNLPPAEKYSGPGPFVELIPNLNRHRHYFISWRNGLRKHSNHFAAGISQAFESIKNVGDFPGLSINPELLAHRFRSEVPSFSRQSFERYGGPASAQFKTYNLCTHKQLGPGNKLMSYWDQSTRRSQGWYFKQITSSFDRIYHPEEAFDPASGKIDLIVNAYREDVGVVSWVEILQAEAPKRACISYGLESPYESLWFVNDVSQQAPESEIEFLISHEWKEQNGNTTHYPMIMMSFKFDFERGEISLVEKPIIRARYQEH